jgi:toxin ParE1/3/4
MTPDFHPFARQELTDAAEFYEARAVGLGCEFLDQMEELVSHLAQFPELGPPDAKGLRTFPARRFPYSVVYQVLGDRLFILAVAHHRRAPNYWAGRAGSP